MPWLVSFSDASRPSRLEKPTTVPPQPPTTNVQWLRPTGTVTAQKKSVPSRRMASICTRKLGPGTFPVQTTPVRSLPRSSRMAPLTIDTSPSPPKDTGFHLPRVVPSKSDTGAAASCALASVRSGLAPSTPSAWRRDSRGAVLFSARAILVEVEGRGTIASSLQEFTA